MKKNEKGFTLVEIIVVLVVMGILLAISVPSIFGYVERTKESIVLHHARNFMQSVQSVAIEEYGSGNAYSNWSGGYEITYEAITNKRPRPDDKQEHDRIRAIYDLLETDKIEDAFEAIAVVEKGHITIIRFKDLGRNIIYEWKRDHQQWNKLNLSSDAPWAGEVLPDGLLGSGIYWNGYEP